MIFFSSSKNILFLNLQIKPREINSTIRFYLLIADKNSGPIKLWLPRMNAHKYGIS